MSSRVCTNSVVVVVLALSQAAICQASDLCIDFGNGLIQDQFFAFPITPGPNAYMEYSSPLGANGTVGIRVQSSPSPSEFEWRIRDHIEGGNFVGLDPLLHDFVFTWSSTALVITVSNLSAGDYSLTSYHHDTQYHDHGAIDVYVTDATGSHQIANQLVQTSGTSPDAIAQATGAIVVAGTGSVTLMIAVVPGSGNAAILNGLSITREDPIAVEQMTWGAFKCRELLPR